jgi:hypothetical protein
MISSAKLTCVQLVAVGLGIVNEGIRTIAFADYYENPVAVFTPLLLAGLLIVWVWTLVRLIRDARNSRPIPAWCKIIQLLIGIGFAFYLTAAARFVIGH